jgi:hypothetical protein
MSTPHTATTLTLIFKTRDGDITQRATADKPRKAYAMALDGIMARFPKEAWRDVDFARASYHAFQMALNAPLGTACCTPYTIVYID